MTVHTRKTLQEQTFDSRKAVIRYELARIVDMQFGFSIERNGWDSTVSEACGGDRFITVLARILGETFPFVRESDFAVAETMTFDQLAAAINTAV